jgi:hypothetical protein
VFHGWDGYFTLLGTAAAGLIGLLFVVVTLTSNYDRAKAQRGQSIYMTPTMLHFAVVLSISAMTLVPGLTPFRATALLAVATLIGLVNTVWACLGIRMLGKGEEPPHWTDFWLYGAAPAVIYVSLGAACVTFALGLDVAPHALGVLLLALLLLGIRNAWDLITWMAPGRNLPPPPAQR